MLNRQRSESHPLFVLFSVETLFRKAHRNLKVTPIFPWVILVIVIINIADYYNMNKEHFLYSAQDRTRLTVSSSFSCIVMFRLSPQTWVWCQSHPSLNQEACRCVCLNVKLWFETVVRWVLIASLDCVSGETASLAWDSNIGWCALVLLLVLTQRFRSKMSDAINSATEMWQPGMWCLCVRTDLMV